MMESLAQNPTSSAPSVGTGRHIWARLGICAIGVLLITAAFLKAASPHEMATLRQAYELPGWLVFTVIVVEVGVGAALLVGFRSRRIWLVTLLLFASFTGFSLFRAFTSHESCGCFGPIKVHPLWVAGLDVAVVAGLLALRRNFSPGSAELAAASTPPWRRWGVAASVLIGFAGVLMQQAQPKMPGSELDGGLTILEPETWAGQEFSLSRHLSPSVDLSRDDWIVVLFHHDCPKCQEALPRYEALAAQLDVGPMRTGVLLVEVPPYGPHETPLASRAHHTRLSDNTEWFVQAPVEIRVSHGKVQSVSLDLPGISQSP